MPEFPTITCGCGFSVSNVSEEVAKQIHFDHSCSVEDGEPGHWLGHIFSMPAVFVVFALGWGVVQVVQALRQ